MNAFAQVFLINRNPVGRPSILTAFCCGDIPSSPRPLFRGPIDQQITMFPELIQRNRHAARSLSRFDMQDDDMPFARNRAEQRMQLAAAIAIELHNFALTVQPQNPRLARESSRT